MLITILISTVPIDVETYFSSTKAKRPTQVTSSLKAVLTTKYTFLFKRRMSFSVGLTQSLVLMLKELVVMTDLHLNDRHRFSSLTVYLTMGYVSKRVFRKELLDNYYA